MLIVIGVISWIGLGLFGSWLAASHFGESILDDGFYIVTAILLGPLNILGALSVIHK